jgi:predicted glycosyltransferase
MISFLLKLPGFIIQLFREYRFLKKLIERDGIEIVVSDNVFGLWNKKVYSIYITHQLKILLPKSLRWMQFLVSQFNLWSISKHDECWVPDIEDTNSLAGKLSHPDKMPENCKYIGILSRFNLFKSEAIDIPVRKNHVLILLSGPEHQRTIFENIIAKQLSDLPKQIKYTVVRGLPDGLEVLSVGWKNHLSAAELYILIRESEYIICRSGYSTIMDLVALNRKAMLVPTPGQTEQEYLASYMQEKGWFSALKQGDFNLNDALLILQNSKQRRNFEALQTSSLIGERLKEIIGNHKAKSGSY